MQTEVFCFLFVCFCFLFFVCLFLFCVFCFLYPTLNGSSINSQSDDEVSSCMKIKDDLTTNYLFYGILYKNNT